MTNKELLRLIGTTQSQDIMEALETRTSEKGTERMKAQNHQTEKPGKYRKKHSHKITLIAAAVIVSLLAGTVAAVIYYRHSLIQDLKDHSLQTPEGYEALLVTAPQTEAAQAENLNAEPELQPLASGKDGVAEYQVLEAILDSESLYFHERIVPLSEDVIFIDQQVMPEDPVEMLENPELSGCTVREYAASQGKKLVYARLVENFDAGIINGWGMHAKTDSDGSLHIYGSGNNPSSTKELHIALEGFTYEPGASGPFLDRTAFDLTLQDESTSDEIVYRTFRTYDPESPDIQKDLGIVLDSLTMKKTELGIYATLQYHPTEKLQKQIDEEIAAAQKVKFEKGETNEDGVLMEILCSPEYIRGQHLISFIMLDENGDYFKVSGPSGGNQGIVDNGDGSYSYTNSIPSMDSTKDLKFRVVDGNMEEIGTYAFSK